VQVASHATALRALDVRVVGVAGGSMLRARKGRLYGVGPRSAHIAGLPYSCYLDATAFDGAVAELVAPRPDDPVEYVVLRLADGRRVAITNTCAAVALGIVHDGDYAAGDADAARAALTVAGGLLRLPAEEVARRMLDASASVVADLVRQVVADHELTAPQIVAVGGGAGGVGRYTAQVLRFDCDVPKGAEVISSIGDALSLLRVERERTTVAPTPAESAALASEAEEECLEAGAAAGSIDVRVEFDHERSTLRAVATGAVGLASGLLPGRPHVDEAGATAIARELGFSDIERIGEYWLASSPTGTLVLLDRFGDIAVEGRGGVAIAARSNGAFVADVEGLVARHTHRLGPVSVAPNMWFVEGGRLLEVAASSTEPVDLHPATIAVVVTRA
jgi:hypothetical protein